MKISYFILFFLISSPHGMGACDIQNSLTDTKDYLKAVLGDSKDCSLSVQDLKKQLDMDGMTALPAMVANRGFHNPQSGSFSIFESVKGYSRIMERQILPEHLYFGHFTQSLEGRVELDQESRAQKLLIEVMAYDFNKGIYNFYEMVGTSRGAQWFYRGNSWDALIDNKKLKLGKPEFGNRMRCSACHSSGGPIMKELSYPHNDWWTKSRGLPFGTLKASEEIEQYVTKFIDASEFSRHVKNGMNLLDKKKMEKGLSLKERLRPLFCSTEVNLKSDLSSLSQSKNYLDISSEVFVDPFLIPERHLKMNKAFYTGALNSLGSKFPEVNRRDGDHGFLAPVKGEVNHNLVKNLIEDRIVNEEFVLDVLSIDYKNPLFSKIRCDLLKLMPESGDTGVFIKRVPSDYAQTFMIQNGSELKKQAQKYLMEKEISWQREAEVKNEVKRLNVLRLSVFRDEISQNPLGQILEPGFRVIFPVF